jgi:hypothetical protein
VIDAILALAIGLPDLLITALVGAVLGGLGGFLGGMLQKLVRVPQLPVILAVAGAVTSVQVSNAIVKPAIVTASLNVDLPKKLDDVTTLLEAKYDGRRYTYHYQLADTFPQDTTIDAMKSGLLEQLCAHWGPEFAKRKLAGADYSYRLGDKVMSFTIEPSDCPQNS